MLVVMIAGIDDGDVAAGRGASTGVVAGAGGGGKIPLEGCDGVRVYRRDRSGAALLQCLGGEDLGKAAIAGRAELLYRTRVSLQLQ